MQKLNTECGCFSMVALEHVLKGGDFEKFCESKFTDDDAFAVRDRMFSALASNPQPQKAGFFASIFK